MPSLRAVVKVGSTTVVALADDLNGDGIDDLILGEPSGGSYPRTGAGNVYVLLGPVGQTDLSTTPAALTLHGKTPFGGVGSPLTLPDMDGDGVRDIASGSGTPAAGGGTVYVVSGALRGEHTVEDSAFLTLSGPSMLGWSLASGDYNGDGHDDLVIGCMLRSEVYIVFGPRSGHMTLPDDADVTLFSEAGSWGRSVSARDLNGDGRTELAVADPVSSTICVVPSNLTGRHAIADVAIATIRSGDPNDNLRGVKFLAPDPSGAQQMIVRAGRNDSEDLGTLFVMSGPFQGEMDLRTRSRLILTQASPMASAASLAGDSDNPPLLAVGLPSRSLIPDSNLNGEFWLLAGDLQGSYALTPEDIALNGRRISAADASVNNWGLAVLFAKTHAPDAYDLIVTGSGAALIFDLPTLK